MAAALRLLAEIDRHTRTVCPADVHAKDCVCAVDLPARDGHPPAHLDLPGMPEVIAARTFPDRHATVVAFLDRPSVEWPEAATVTVYRHPAAGVES